MNSSPTGKTATFVKPTDIKVNTEFFSLGVLLVAAISLSATLMVLFGTIFNGADAAKVDIEDNLWTKSVTPTIVCLLLFGIAFYYYFIRLNTSKAQLAIFFLSFLSITLSMLALAFSLFQVSVTKT